MPQHPAGGRKCRSRNKQGNPCGQWAAPGGLVCRWHGGLAPQVKAKAAVRAEVIAWGLGDAHVDPGEVLLRLVSQSAARAQRYSVLLERAYDAAERLRDVHQAHGLIDEDALPDHDEPIVVTQAREDLHAIFNTGGIAALVGKTYSASNTGSLYATGEQIRGLAQLEATERDRCANFAAKAVAAGLAERQVKLAERQGALLVELMTAVLGDLGLADEQIDRLPELVERHLAVVAG